MFKYELSHPDIREGIKKLCDKFDADYWQKCDRENSYPLKFVNELSDAGYLSALIPEKFGGLGLPISSWFCHIRRNSSIRRKCSCLSCSNVYHGYIVKTRI